MYKLLVAGVNLTGHGIVNFGDKEKINGNDNNKGAKRLKDGRALISSESFKSALLPTHGHELSKLVHPSVRDRIYAKPSMGIRGWMVAATADNYQRKSPITVSNFVQTSGDNPEFHIHSSAGDKVDATSLYHKMTTADITYAGEIRVDLSELAFLPMDAVTGRLSLPLSIFESKHYREQFLKEYGVEAPVVGRYKKLTDSQEFPEHGAVMPDQYVNVCVRHLVESLKAWYVTRSGSGHAGVSAFTVTAYENLVDYNMSQSGVNRGKLLFSFPEQSEFPELLAHRNYVENPVDYEHYETAKQARLELKAKRTKEKDKEKADKAAAKEAGKVAKKAKADA